jgi:hypothetical protein
MQKKGLSSIVVTLILIVLSLVAVGAVWLIVSNLLKGQSDQVNLDKITFDAGISALSLDNSTNNVSLVVQRNVGEANLKGMKFYFYNDSDAEVMTEYFIIGELGAKQFTFHLGMNISNLDSVSIVPIFNTKDGKDSLGNVADSFDVKKGIHTTSSGGNNSTCAPTTCSNLGYTCGAWPNGSCSGTLNCGSCNSTQTCPSGTCVNNASCTPSNYTYSCLGNISMRLDNCLTQQNITCSSNQTCVTNITRCINNITNVTSCVPTTCSALGYGCGSWANGTCSGTLNCGSCSSGYNCVSGNCVLNGTSLFGWQLNENNTGLARLGINKLTLSNYTGSASPAAGTVISDRRIEFQLDLSAGNITIQRCWIYPHYVNPGMPIIYGREDTGNYANPSNVIKDSELDGSNITVDGAISTSPGIWAGNIIIDSCSIHDMGAGVALEGNKTVVMKNTYIYHLRDGQYSPGQWSHTDGFTIRSFSGPIANITNNRIVAYNNHCTGAAFFQATWAGSPFNNITLNGNLFEGNGYNLILEWGNGGYGTNLQVINNRFNSSGYGGYGIGYVTGGPGWSVWTNNYLNSPGQVDNQGAVVNKPLP